MIITYRHMMKDHRFLPDQRTSCHARDSSWVPPPPVSPSQNTPRAEMTCPLLSHKHVSLSAHLTTGETAKPRSNLTKLPLRCFRIYISTPLSYAEPLSVSIRRCIRCLHLDLSLTPLPFPLSLSLSLYSLSLSSVSLSPQPARLGSFLSVTNRSRVAFQTPWVLFFFHHSKLERVGSVSENAKDLLRRI